MIFLVTNNHQSLLILLDEMLLLFERFETHLNTVNFLSKFLFNWWNQTSSGIIHLIISLIRSFRDNTYYTYYLSIGHLAVDLLLLLVNVWKAFVDQKLNLHRSACLISKTTDQLPMHLLDGKQWFKVVEYNKSIFGIQQMISISGRELNSIQ